MIISDSTSSCPPFILNLRNTSTNFSSFNWDFNDGSFSNLDTPSHYYNVPGVYKIKLITKGYGTCSDTATTTITLRGPSGQFTYSPQVICAPGKANFRASTKNRASFIWDFGDGTSVVSPDYTISHTYVNAGKYRPKLLLVDQAGCQVPISGKDTIVIAKADANIRSVATTYCDSATVQFFDSSLAKLDVLNKYVWLFGDGTKDSINRNPVHTFKTTGNYAVKLQVTTRGGCNDTDSLASKVKVIKSPEIGIDAAPGVCMDVPITFKGKELIKDSSVLAWKWNFGNGVNETGQFPPRNIYKTAGRYSILATAINSSGCSNTAVIPIDVYQTPRVNAGIDTVLCLGNSLLMQPSGADTYRWENNTSLSCSNCPTPVARPADVNWYRVTGTTVDGCSATDTIRIQVAKPFKMTAASGDTLCFGESFTLQASGSDNFAWWPAVSLNNANIAQPTTRPDTTTNYRVVVSDRYKCFSDTGYIRVVVYPIPQFNILQDAYTINVGHNVKFNTTRSPDITRYRWTPYLGLNCHNCPEPTASPRTTTTYRAQVWNDGGCTAEDKVTVTVLCNNSNVFIPNTFSPNGDGMNDAFYVRGKGITIRSMTVFNRWGVVVFQTNGININDAQAGWNGMANGVNLPPDVYVYKVDVVCENNEVFSLKGNISLVR